MGRPESGERLDGWKAIAAFFGRDERTVKRWEGARGLPVRRIPGGGRAAVWADTAELQRWLAGADETVAADETPAPIDRRWLLASLGVVALAGAGVAAVLLLPDRRQPTDGRAPDVAAYADDPSAQALYMHALLAWDSRTPNGLAEAVTDLTEVIRRHPDRPEGYAKLADCYLLLREFGVMPEAEAYDRAEAAAREAIRLNPRAASALRALAFIRFWGRADPGALDLFRRALEVQPQSIQTRQWYGNALSARGLYRDALAQFREARRLEPTNLALSAGEAGVRAQAGDLAGAAQDIRRLTALYPQSIQVRRTAALIALTAGDAPGYLREAEIEAGLRQDARRLAALKTVRAAYEQGGASAMFAALAVAEAQARGAGRGDAVMTANFWALAGRPDEARRWLAIARAAHEPALIYLPSLPKLARLGG
jgi:tetratricopeptide (TPR) repeat protein